MARIQAVIRRSRCQSPSVISTGRLKVNLDAKTAAIVGVRIGVTPKEFAILELLSLRKGTALSRDMFLNHLYDGKDEPRDQDYRRIRLQTLRKQRHRCGGENYIHTVWGSGYKLREPQALDLAA